MTLDVSRRRLHLISSPLVDAVQEVRLLVDIICLLLFQRRCHLLYHGDDFGDIDKLTRADPGQKVDQSTRLAGDPSPVVPQLHQSWAWQNFLQQLETVVVVQHLIVS